MNTQLDCLPCFLNQAIRSARLATRDPHLIDKTIAAVVTLLPKIDFKTSPPQTGALVDQLVKVHTKTPDPFLNVKRESTRKALSLYPHLKGMVLGANDPLLAAIKIAIAGNVIDFGVSRTFSLEEELADILDTSLSIDHYSKFKKALQNNSSVLYLGDNAGETVFDRILIEQMQIPTTYVVREKAVLNDATMEDAREAGLDKISTVISSGSPAPATILPFCSREFLEMFRQAPMIISKGQGNYEALSDEKGPIFYLLKAKCNVVANHLSVDLGNIILKANPIFMANEGKKSEP